MKKLLLLLATLTITGFATGCHDDRERHTPITTSTTTETTSTHVAPSATSTTVERY
jgi:hypothetical protein